MTLDKIQKLEELLKMHKENFPKMPDFNDMPPEVLDGFMIRALRDEIKQIKNICNYHHIDITTRQGFEAGLRIYSEKYCNDEMREFYSDEVIIQLGELFDEYQGKLC